MIRLEDSRILDDSKGMKKRVTQLQMVGENFMRENEIRDNNYRELTSSLKELNTGVQNVSRIRGMETRIYLSCFLD